MQDIISFIIVGYIIYKLMAAGLHLKARDFFVLTRTSAKAQGTRGTVHSIVDGLFDNSAAIKSRVSGLAGSAKSTASAKVSGLKPADFKYDASRGELTIYLSKAEDLVLGKGKDGVRYALLMHISGRETRLSPRNLERHLSLLERRGTLSVAQERAIKDFMRL